MPHHPLRFSSVSGKSGLTENPERRSSLLYRCASQCYCLGLSPGGYRAGALTQVEVRAFWEVRTWLSRDNQGPALEEAVYHFHAQWDLAALSLVFCLFFLPQVVPVAARLLLEMFSGELSWSADSIRLQISNPDLKDHMVEQFKELHHIWQSQQRLQGQVLQPGPVAQAPPVAGFGADQGPWPMHPVSMQ